VPLLYRQETIKGYFHKPAITIFQIQKKNSWFTQYIWLSKGFERKDVKLDRARKPRMDDCRGHASWEILSSGRCHLLVPRFMAVGVVQALN
jgi:hypothetical protein